MYTHKPHNISAKEFLKDKFTWTDSKTGAYNRVLDCSIVRLREAYLAVEYGDADGAKGVFGLVCLLDYRPNDYYNFGYKDMAEEMGPYFYNCPERILELLTPTDDEWALKWRETCWKVIREKKEKKTYFKR
ncbi:MAG: hypothetical protein HPY90_11735 [Syntrophothermus sp.]|uniref:hypothetical protein n=1 Tax=Syntrophothermus sp. TaxID=2736299 RepID=UPI00257CA834|nr:hypothetical protein [Syntrophothermus sp.]NSW83918.1 hypothetical protein [Syntrophothermus sp.]